jgi:hypothetical protein
MMVLRIADISAGVRQRAVARQIESFQFQGLGYSLASLATPQIANRFNDFVFTHSCLYSGATFYCICV